MWGVLHFFLSSWDANGGWLDMQTQTLMQYPYWAGYRGRMGPHFKALCQIQSLRDPSQQWWHNYREFWPTVPRIFFFLRYQSIECSTKSYCVLSMAGESPWGSRGLVGRHCVPPFLRMSTTLSSSFLQHFWLLLSSVCCASQIKTHWEPSSW